MWLVVGLGNPGPRYQRTRHNIGFMVVDELASRGGAQGWRTKFGGEITTCNIGGENTLLLKPMEFMNLSGYAVQRACQFHKVTLDELVVVHDEIDIDFGRVMLKTGGGHGGHNGIRSIIDQLAKRDFHRVRVGVGRPGSNAGAPGPGTPANSNAGGGDKKVASYLLADFGGSQAEQVPALIGRAADASADIIALGIRSAMNTHHAKPENKPPGKKSSGKDTQLSGRNSAPDPTGEE